jgi:hypothetical protein
MGHNPPCDFYASVAEFYALLRDFTLRFIYKGLIRKLPDMLTKTVRLSSLQD